MVKLILKAGLSLGSAGEYEIRVVGTFVVTVRETPKQLLSQSCWELRAEAVPEHLGSGILWVLLMIEILHDLIYQICRNQGSNYSTNYILGDAGFLSSTEEGVLRLCCDSFMLRKAFSIADHSFRIL